MPNPQFRGHAEIFVGQRGAEQSTRIQSLEVSNKPRKLWLHIVLFLLTVLTTTVFGFALAQSFSANQPFDAERLLDAYWRLAHRDWRILSGLVFSVPLLFILLAHEFGHYIACRRSRVNASLPYFLPSPTLLGTLGAFIRIRSPIYSRTDLFDIGASGPLAGIVALVPVLAVGIGLSRVVPGIEARSDFLFGTPLLMRLAEWLRFGAIRPSDISLHPMAMAAWAGLIATAMNLLPVGQLDGGHILYAVLGEKWHRYISNLFIAALVTAGFFYQVWWLFALLLFFFGRRHPLVYDRTPVSRLRRWLTVVVFIVFLLSILLVPVELRSR